MLTRSKEGERHLIGKAKRLQTKLDGQRDTLNKADEFPENINTSDSAKMREQWLRSNNSLGQIEERRYQMDYKLTSLQEERDILQREFNRLPKPGVSNYST